jgi:hypothetical protein
MTFWKDSKSILERNNKKHRLKKKNVAPINVVDIEKTFKNLMFMKTKLWNRLCGHLDLVVWIYIQPFYKMNNFLYNDQYQIGQWIVIGSKCLFDSW